MTKLEELEAAARGEGCLGRSADDEPIFVLCARDRAASETVRQWAANAASAGCKNTDKLNEALRQASLMDDWRARMGGGKVPD
jgi:hypothetical protein